MVSLPGFHPAGQTEKKEKLRDQRLVYVYKNGAYT